jgi:putative phage-type endonuclease
MNIEYFDYEQGSKEWHDLRTKYYKTASRTPTVLGVNPFSNIENLAKEIKFGIKHFYSDAMRQGNDLEDMVRNKANEIFGDVFMPKVAVKNGLLASLDGINFDEDTIIEIKVSEKTYNDLKNGVIPENYLWQIKHQMYVFNVSDAFLVAYNPNNDDIATSAIQCSDDDFKTINEAWLKFDEYLESYELPTEKVIENDTAYELLEKYKEAKSMIEYYSTVLNNCKEGLESCIY